MLTGWLWRCLVALLATRAHVVALSSLQRRRLVHGDSQFSKRGGGPFLCESADDVRATARAAPLAGAGCFATSALPSRRARCTTAWTFRAVGGARRSRCTCTRRRTSRWPRMSPRTAAPSGSSSSPACGKAGGTWRTPPRRACSCRGLTRCARPTTAPTQRCGLVRLFKLVFKSHRRSTGGQSESGVDDRGCC
jgi:hypothetical protein